jgi:wyosine [tRNA(Phe)-imidazoG37] synthetase (radical SAM superfamily)
MVYGPVQSWRFGRSLGIDPIGAVSVCSYDCVYCQLGGIERLQGDRQWFVPTAQIVQDLQPFAPWAVDILTLSGSGEPTLALNLGDIITQAQQITQRPVGVLTNGSLLNDPQVQQELAQADRVAIKLDAVQPEDWHRINRPVAPADLPTLWRGITDFRRIYTGHLALQTMVLSPWDEASQQTYIDLITAIAPDEIQLNTPTRPKPLQHQLDARSNTPDLREQGHRRLRPVSPEVLQSMGDRIQAATQIPTRCPPMALLTPAV